MNERCKNFIQDGRMSLQCGRDSSGDDGLCNICRAAKRRGERSRERNDELYRQHLQENSARLERERRDRMVGEWLRKHDPDRYAEIMEVSK